MTENIIIIDNVIDINYQNKVEEFFLQSNFPWFYQSDISFFDDHISQLHTAVKKRPGFSNLIYDSNSGPFNPYHFVLPILYTGCFKHQVLVNNVTQIRSFLLVPPNLHDEDRKDRPHIDQPNPHFAAIYYVNDSDGETYIYNKKFNPSIDSSCIADIDPSTLPIVETISPKKGRLVIFNGLYFHSSSQPEHNARCIINFNFT